MSNPLLDLIQLSSPSKATRGVVMAFAGDLVQIATPRGIVEYESIGGLVVGDSVTITNEGRIIKTTDTAPVYWV